MNASHIEDRPVTRIPTGTIFKRAFRLRCPRCGQTKLFRGLFRMEPTCTECGFKYEREPGYFLGSAYVNYGLTALIVTFSYIVLRLILRIENHILIGPLAAFCVLFPLFSFRYARAFWMAMDCHFDRTGFDRED